MASTSLLLGAHMSTAGGVHTAFERAALTGCTTMQVFVKNANQWSGPPLDEEDIKKYKSAGAETRIDPVIAHASYLINLCAANSKTLSLGRRAYIDELQRCNLLGIKALVLHPGSHVGAGEDDGIKKIAESLNVAHEKTKGCTTLTALECTAGQGTAIGYRFEHLRGIIDGIDDGARMAVCLDTCHLFAAGYDIGTMPGWNRTMKEFEEIVGFDRLVAIHVNDSKRELGSRIDRHEHIGKGHIGTEGFRYLMNEERLVGIPKILETEKSEDMHEDIENMNFLRGLATVGKSL